MLSSDIGPSDAEDCIFEEGASGNAVTNGPFLCVGDEDDAAATQASPQAASDVKLFFRHEDDHLDNADERNAGDEDHSDHRSEEERDIEWRLRQKHIFILNSSGRPVFTRYGDEGDFVDLFGIFRVLVSMAGSNVLSTGGEMDTLRRITAGPNHVMHFHTNGELIYVMVTRTGESAKACLRQLKMMHNQILSILPTANAILKRNASYDIRKMISSADVKVMKFLVKAMSTEPTFYFRCLQAVAMPPKYRADVDQILKSHRCGDDHLFSFLFHRKRIVSVVTPNKMPLHPDDALLLLNFTSCLARSQSGVQWATICLPVFNDTGYLWCYCQNVSVAVREHLRSKSVEVPEESDYQGENGLLLVHLSASQEMFARLMQSGQEIVEALASGGTYREIESFSQNSTLVPHDSPLSTEDILGPSMALWFMLVTESGQLVCSTQAPQFMNSKSARKHTLRQWVKMKDKLTQISMAPTPFLIVTLEDFSYLVLRQRGVGDVFAVFISSVPKAEMMKWAVRWAKWAKGQEKRYTITTACMW